MFTKTKKLENKMNHTYSKRIKSGFTLVETLFYTVGLLVLFATMTVFMYYMYDWYQKVSLAPRTDRIGISLTDKLVKDIRSGVTINLGQTNYNINNGTLSINSLVNSVTIAKYFSINSGRLTYQEDAGATSFLTPSDLTVTRFFITASSTTISEGIKFDIDIAYRTRNGTTTQTYSGFSILRQSY